MKVYLAIKFHEDLSNRKLIEDISDALEKAGHTSTVAVRDFEKWGTVQFSSQEIMAQDFQAIREADLLLVEFSEKGVGLGIAIGFAKALGKPIVVIAKTGSEISDTVQGTVDKIIFYQKTEELVEVCKAF